MSVTLPAGRDRDAWQVALWNADEAVLSRSQRLALMMMLEAGFNNFDPFRVVRDLLAHRDLWESAEMIDAHADLLSLRDMAGGHWHRDTLYILHYHSLSSRLERLAAGWSADEVHVGSARWGHGRAGDPAILRVWWD